MSDDDAKYLAKAVARGVASAVRQFRPLDGATAKALALRLLGSSPEHRRLLLQNLAGLRRYEVVQELLREYRRSLHGEPQAIVAAAEIAIEAAESVLGLPRALECDLRAECWMALANSLRIVEKYDLAEAAWRTVDVHRASGTGDQHLRAEASALKGSLRSEQQRFPEAIRFLRRAIRIFDQLDESTMASRNLIRLGMTFQQAGDLQSAIANTWQGLRRVATTKEPLLVSIALQNLVIMYHSAGMTHIALQLMSRVESSYAQHSASAVGLRGRWTVARIYGSKGYQFVGAQVLNSVRRDFIALGTPYEAAMVALDQAAIYAQLSEHAKVRELAREMIPVFRSKQIVREARVALALFVRASRAEALTAEAIARFSRRVEDAAAGTWKP